MGGNSATGIMATWQQAFLERHHLDSAYLEYARRWFAPLGKTLAAHLDGAGAPGLVAVNGCQGSGKTTACDYLQAMLEAELGLRVLTLSLDDFYLPRAGRADLAASVHPLLQTRGVPGTHDMDLLNATLDVLLTPSLAPPVPVPRFDKARDDRREPSAWDKVEGKLDLVLLEGWCLGARPQTEEQLVTPVNALEREEDPDGTWRAYVNRALAREFLPLYERVDSWVMLQAPSFDCVYRWRLEQEHKLALAQPRVAAGIMDDNAVARFIQHYQRLTQYCLATLPPEVDYLYTLDDQRRITSSRPEWEAVG